MFVWMGRPALNAWPITSWCRTYVLSALTQPMVDQQAAYLATNRTISSDVPNAMTPISWTPTTISVGNARTTSLGH